MQINIHGVGVKLTDSLKDYVNDKFKRLERKAGGNLHAEHQAESMYPAIDGLIDKVDGQLVKYKEKLKS